MSHTCIASRFLPRLLGLSEFNIDFDFVTLDAPAPLAFSAKSDAFELLALIFV